MYTVYGTVYSRAFRVLWALEELGQPYELKHSPPHSTEAQAVNPSGKIPALRDGDTILTDSSAILSYLADKHAGLTYPAGTIARAQQDGWLHLVLDEFDALLWTAARHSRGLPEDQLPEVVTTLKTEYERNLARLNAGFSGPFLMGETLTVADIVLCHCLGWAQVTGFAAPPDTLRAYSKSLRSREAYRKVMSLASDT